MNPKTTKQIENLTQKAILQELYQAVLGIPQNPTENGLVGIVHEISEKLDKVNGRTRGNEIRSKINQTLILTIIGGSGITAFITKLTHVW